MQIIYTRLFADEAGDSHFAEVTEPLPQVDFIPPAAQLNLSAFRGARQTAFFGAPAGWVGDWHVSPTRNLFVVLCGSWRVEASDGDVRDFGPRSVLLVEDTTGKGHTSRILGDEDSLALLVQL